MKNAEPPLFTKMYDITRWLLERVEGFPRVHRVTIGQRVSECALIILEDLTRAQFRKKKRELLMGCNERLDTLRVLLRLAVDTKALSFRQYEFITGELQEAGRMLGGWIAHQRQA